ncbi:MAG: hypothetical protein K2O06_00875 [Acetatifactor sp.]|nr:hypothetical protein [Acetatifactor sp.]
MVQPVAAVPKTGRTGRDNRRMVQPYPKTKNSGSRFAQVLEETTRKPESAAPRYYNFTTYDRDSRLQNHRYLSTEYRY